MATVASLGINIRKLAGDPDRDWLDENTLFDFLNRAQRRFCHKVMALDELKDYTITAKQPRFDLPTDCIMPIWVTWYQSRVTKLEYTTPDHWARVMEAYPTSTGVPERYAVIRRQLNVGPQVPTTASSNSTGSGAMTSTGTTLSLVAASGTFRSKGWIAVDDEIIEFTGVATTTLTGCVRGVHNTTAATHASGVTVTQIDLQMLYRKTPNIISASTATPEVPAMFQDYLELYSLYLAFLSRGDGQKAQAVLTQFDEYEKDAIKTVGRRSQDGLIRIQERTSRFRWW